MIREYIHDSCCPICNRAETTERVIREEEGCTKVSRVCTACGGEWRSSLDGHVIQNLRIKKLEAENERLRENVDRLGKEVERADRLRAEIARVKADNRSLVKRALEGKP